MAVGVVNHQAFCGTCGQPVTWVSAMRAAYILGLSERRVRQLLAAGRLPGAVKSPGQGNAPWQVPLTSLAALIESRRK